MGKDDPTCTFLKHIQIPTLRYNVNADMYPFANSMCDVYITFVGFMKLQALPIFDLQLIYFTSVADFLKALILRLITSKLKITIKMFRK